MIYKKITPTELKDSLDYKIACAIFKNDKDTDFTIEDIVKCVKSESAESVELIKEKAQTKLQMLMDNMQVYQHGSYYRVKKI